MGIKYSVNEKFFNSWGQEMAYVLGYIYADGSLEDASYLRGKYLRITSVERRNIEKIKKWMDSEHKIIKSRSDLLNGRDRYLLRIGSHKLFDDLVRLGLYPNKSLTIKLPYIPPKYLGDFTRGYLDGDGCVYLERARGKNQKLIVKKLSVIFSSGSKLFLDELNIVFRKKLFLSQDKVYSGQRCFQLRYTTKDSIKLFKFLYKDVKNKTYLKRKFDIFAKYFKLRPIKIDKDIKNILEYIGIGHVVK